MSGKRVHALAGLVLVAAACGMPSSANAQFFGGNPCVPCGQPIAAAPVAVMPTYQTAAVTDCPCMRPVTETVYQDVDQVDYRPVQKTVKVAKVVTVMEDRDFTTYQPVTEARTVEVPSYITQTHTEYQQVAYNQSYWRTQWQPNCKPSPCQVDQRPGLLGEMNRLNMSFWNSFTPNYTASRQFVPNVVTATVPVQRTVQVPTSRQVTYNVTRMVPVTTAQKVPVQRTVWEDQTVTAYEPQVSKKRVAVGTRTRMAYVDPSTTSRSASAEPTPAATAEGTPNNTQTGAKGSVRLQSAPADVQPNIQSPVFRRSQENTAPQVQPESRPAGEGPVAVSDDAVPSVAQANVWRSTKSKTSETTPVSGPELSVAKK